MKLIVVILLGCILPACFAELLFKQPFEDPTFPPSGWEIEITGSGPAWEANWERDNFPPFGYWASGHALTSGAPPFTEPSIASAKLYSPAYTLSNGSTLVILVGYDAETWTSYCGTATMSLLEGEEQTPIANFSFPVHLTSGIVKPETTKWTVPIPTSSSYCVCWQCSSVSNYQGCSVALYLNEIIMYVVNYSDKSTISPSSLGRIKSAYK